MPAAGSPDLDVTTFFLPGDTSATVTFTGSGGGLFPETFSKPRDDDFRMRTYTFTVRQQ
jgi:hypothetical protein